MKISFYPMVRREQFGARGIHIPNKNGDIMHKELLRVSQPHDSWFFGKITFAIKHIYRIVECHGIYEFETKPCCIPKVVFVRLVRLDAFQMFV